MKPGQLLRAFAAASAIAVHCEPARAVDALSFPQGLGSDVSGFESGGFGWSFVPTTNITVTSVGYLDIEESGGDPAVVVTIWSGTNSALASFAGITNAGAPSGSIISAPINPLPLAAGQPYSITVYAAPLSNSVTGFAVFDNTGTISDSSFALAPELSQFQGLQLNPNGTFSPLSSNPAQNQQLLYLGPTFSYSFGATRPVLQIAAAGAGSVRLSWPTNAAGFTLQLSSALTAAFAAITNVPSVSGTNYTTTLPATNDASFFRLAGPI